MLAASRLAMAAAALSVGTAAGASPQAEELCRDVRTQYQAGLALTQWAQNVPFARVIIGGEGGDGRVSNPQIAVETHDFVICRGVYALMKTGPKAETYTVRIPAFFYRVTPNAGGFSVTLEDFPAGPPDSQAASRELLARFTIDGRPYLDVLEENQRRLQRRGQRTAQ